jgi:hypothetical protein
VAVLVGYLAVTRHDIQAPADADADLPLSPQIVPARAPRRGY